MRGAVPEILACSGVSKGESAIAFPPSLEGPQRGDDLLRPRRVGIGLRLQGMEQGPDARHLPLPAALLPEESADLPIAVLEEGDLDIPLGRMEAVVGFRQELLVGESVHERHQMTSLGREGQHLVVRELVAPRAGVELALGDFGRRDASTASTRG